MTFKRVLMVCSVLALGTVPSFAETAFTAPASGVGPPDYQANLPVNLGDVFTTTSTMTVNGLGFYDQTYLTGPETLGLYNSSGVLLASTVVSLTDPVVNGYFFHSIGSLVLAPGTYTVVAQVNDNPWSYGPAPSTAPGVTFNYDSYLYGSSLAFTTQTGGSGPAYYGPNVNFPEPGVSGVLTMGFAGLLFAVRRRKIV